MAMNATAFFEALDQLEAERGIRKEVVIEALREAIIKAYKKQLGGDDAVVRCDIDLEKGTIDLYEVKIVRDEVVDDFLEISTEEANRLRPGQKFKDGDEFIIPAPIDEIRKATAMKIKSLLKQKFSETEKEILYEAYKDKIGTIITGRVERVEDNGVSVNIGKASVYLPRKQMIGNESFNIGDPIKVYISQVSGDSKGAKIVVTRASEGFLRCLFEDADGITDVYNGTIIIKAIARRAGERSKVAVYSKDPNVDPAAACIGPNGTRIQKIVSQLGNGTNKEKIDIITYSEVTALYIMESIKPAKAIGVEVDEENNEATIVVADDALNVAVGKRGVNIALAAKLTGFKLNIVPESEAMEDQIEFVTYDQAQLEAVEKQAAQRAAEERAQVESLHGAPEGYVAPQERVYADESNDVDAALEESVENEEVEAAKPEEPAKEEKPAEQAQEERPAEETTNVKTTTTIEDLEKSLEEDKSKKGQAKKKSSRKKKEEEEEEETSEPVTKTDSGTRMSIYTEEELAEIEAEEAAAREEDEEDEEDIDYDEYDEYYDDDDR